jgi:hypothetical protein
MRLGATIVLAIALVTVVLVSSAGGEAQSVKRTTAFQVVRRPYQPPQLLVWLPFDAAQPALTGNRQYLTLTCYASSGRALVSWRRPWTGAAGTHFHILVPLATARRVDRCRLSGGGAVFEQDAIDGPTDGTHPRDLPRQYGVELNPLGFR